MNEFCITIPVSAYKTFDPSVQQALMSYVTAQLGVSISHEPNPEGRDESGLAKLDVSEAKLFLKKCNEKTTLILQEIVNLDGNFTSSAIAALIGTPKGELRGAWAGLTKRVRTVKEDPKAFLFDWIKRDDDWHGYMAVQTVASMRIALNTQLSHSQESHNGK